MGYLFKGTICGRLCDDCEEDLSNAVVKLYRLREDQQKTILATASPKNTFAILSNKEVDAKEDFLIAESRTNAKGHFQFELGENQDYEGEAFEIDIYVEKAPGQEERPAATEPVQFSLTTLQPQWRQRKEGLIAGWEHCISHRFWCRVRELLGAYVICGRVQDCEMQIPLPGVKVSAFDRDWLQDDPLGSALTDSSGYFKIYYSANDFKQGTFIDVELFGGPDLYFHVETVSGSPLLLEDPSRGRDADRENTGACFCVSLCPENPAPPPEPEPVFTDIGGYNYETDINSLPSGNGLTVGSNRAFYSNIRLNGILSKKLNGNPMEYRFEYRELDSTGSPITGWERVTSGQIAKTKIGKLERANPAFPGLSPNPIETIDYVVGTPDADEIAATIVSDTQGDWIQVPQESSSAFSSTGFFNPNGSMIRLRTATLASYTDVDLSGLETGTVPHPQVSLWHITVIFQSGCSCGKWEIPVRVIMQAFAKT